MQAVCIQVFDKLPSMVCVVTFGWNTLIDPHHYFSKSSQMAIALLSLNSNPNQ